MAKKEISRNFRYPSADLREKVRVAVKERGFRSEQAFLITACANELRRGENTEAVTQFESRIAATFNNMAKQVQGLHTLGQAQVALTDVLLKYIITCVVEPPEDALPAPRVRARLRPLAERCFASCRCRIGGGKYREGQAGVPERPACSVNAWPSGSATLRIRIQANGRHTEGMWRGRARRREEGQPRRGSMQ